MREARVQIRGVPSSAVRGPPKRMRQSDILRLLHKITTPSVVRFSELRFAPRKLRVLQNLVEMVRKPSRPARVPRWPLLFVHSHAEDVI